MALSKLNKDKDNLTIDINIEKLLGSASNNEVIRETFFQLAYDKLVDRLDKGLSVDNKPLKGYSASYKGSLAYDVFGKDGTVDMQLTGDMISSIDIKKQNSTTLTVGFGSKEESNKAYGHMTGMEGHPTLEGKVRPRNFFGWSDKELNDIARELRPAISKANLVSDAKLLTLIDRLLA